MLPGTPNPAVSIDSPPASVLVVDDEAGNRTTLKRFLERAGFRVVTAERGALALELIGDDHFDLILLDLLMPEMNGLEVLRRIRALHPRDRLPVLMTTSVTDSATVVEALEIGANDYLGKPFDFPKLIARVGIEVANLRLREPPPPGVGSVLADRYRLRKVLGSGSFGTVYAAVDLERDEQAVSIKLVHPHLVTDAETFASFHHEARTVCRLNHPNLIRALAFGVTHEGIPYLVNELVPGTTLDELLLHRPRLDAVLALSLGQAVATGLAHAHAVGVVHRDLKPANILLASGEGHWRPMLFDFGIACLRDQPAVSEGHVGLGTPTYMAPELFLGHRADDRADIYALGAMLHEMLVGEPPFEAPGEDPAMLSWLHIEAAPPRPSEFLPGCSIALDQLILDCLAKEPGERPTAPDLATRLAFETQAVMQATTGPPS